MNVWTVPGFIETRDLGSGGSGRVVMAVEQSTSTPVAIKYLDDRLVEEPRFLHEFRAEAHLLRQLDSPYVARFHRYVETQRGTALVMELIEGPSLRTLLKQEGATTPEAALVVLKGSLLGLSAAHGVGVVHRDYKPENVLITAEGTSKLVDVGIAARDGSTPTSAGTPMYMAPEQWQGQNASPATDVYAATVTFFECLTGARPFHGDHLAEIAMQHLSAEIPAEAAPEPVRQLILRGMAKYPADRPRSAAAFLAELEAVAAAGYGDNWERRGRRALAVCAAGLLLGPPAPSAVGSDATTSLATTDLGEQDGAEQGWQLGDGKAAGGAVASAAGTRAGSRLKVSALIAVGVTIAVGVLAGVVINSETSGNSAAAAPGSVSDVSSDGASASSSESVAEVPEGPGGEDGSTTTSGSGSSGAASGSSGSSGASGSSGSSGGPGAVPVSDTVGGAGATPLPPGTTVADATAPGTGGSSASGGTASPTSKPVAVSDARISKLEMAPKGRAADADLTITTTDTGPVVLTLTWYNSDEKDTPGKQDGETESYSLEGRTTYNLTYHHTFDDSCPQYWGLKISTTPTAKSGDTYKDMNAQVCTPTLPPID